MVGVEDPVGAGHLSASGPIGRQPRTAVGELARDLLRVIPALGLSPAHERVATARAETFLDAALGGQATTNDTRRQARRLVAVLRATGNQRASALASTLGALDHEPDPPG